MHRVGNLVLYKEIHVDNVVVSGDHGAFTFVERVPAAAGIAQLNLLVDVGIHLVGLLDAKGQLEVDARVHYIRDFPEGGDHGLLFVVHSVPAGASHGDDDQGQQHSQNGLTCPFEAGFWFFGFWRCFRCPAIGSVFVHVGCSFSKVWYSIRIS